MRTLLLTLCLAAAVFARAENWDYVVNSGEYYYGIGTAATEPEASQLALAEMMGMIATQVSSDFQLLTDETSHNGSFDHKTQVLNCIKTYSQGSLTNVGILQRGKEPKISVLRFMKRSELYRIYEGRIAKAKDMVQMADEAQRRGKIDMALQYYYWAYSLVRSVQRPNEVKDDNGRLMVNWIPQRIDETLAAVSVSFEKREGDCVDLLFNYQGKPVSSIEFNYNDGRAQCQGSAKDGRGMMEMVPGYETDTYHLSIEYEYKGQARGDAEMQGVLDVISPKVFPKAAIQVKGKVTASARKQAQKSDPTGVRLQPAASQTVAQTQDYADVAAKVIEAIRQRNTTEAARYFTFEGKEMFRQLIGYGTGRVVGTPSLTFFKSSDGRVVARGLQMSFSFSQGTKKTFVEDVVLTFNQDKQIESLAFGLGQQAENDILCKQAPGWKDETREMLMEFLENYKTAYCLKRIDYIRDIFADDAIIIIGNVTRRTGTPSGQERPVSVGGQQIIQYNRYTKNEYLNNLQRCFKRNEFINLRFTNNDIQWLEKYKNEEIFAIQIGQEYNSSTYGDKGYLFLLVNMTNHEQPQIKVRTWQPNEVDMDKIYNAGDFYSD